MQKLLGIVVLGLLLSGNAYADEFKKKRGTQIICGPKISKHKKELYLDFYENTNVIIGFEILNNNLVKTYWLNLENVSEFYEQKKRYKFSKKNNISKMIVLYGKGIEYHLTIEDLYWIDLTINGLEDTHDWCHLIIKDNKKYNFYSNSGMVEINKDLDDVFEALIKG